MSKRMATARPEWLSKTAVSLHHGACILSDASQTHDIFEGTEQIQQLVISRAISGMRIE